MKRTQRQKKKFDNTHTNHTNIHAHSHKKTHSHTRNKFQNSSAQFEKNKLILPSNEKKRKYGILPAYDHL